MGRELRMVPPNWEHPRKAYTNYEIHYKPMFETSFRKAADDWTAGFLAWLAKYPSGVNEDGYRYWEYEGDPPEKDTHAPFEDSEATWFQLFENVSEGTPVSPPFATAEELVEYLVANGDFWDQKNGHGQKYSRKAAESLVRGGYCPSMIVVDGKVFAHPSEQAELMAGGPEERE